MQVVWVKKVEKSLSDVIREIKDELNLSQIELGKAIGANLDRIKSLMSGKATNLSRNETRLLVENLHVNPEWLTTGKGQMLNTKLEVNEERAMYSTRSEFVMVPRYDVQASAGNGTLIQSELIVDHLAFREDWILRMGLSSKKLALIMVDGDSMEPTLHNGDLVLIDLRTDGYLLNGIYAIQYKGYLLIKRIQSKLDGSIVIRSDNSMYESEILTDNEESFIVVGRVVWFGRTM